FVGQFQHRAGGRAARLRAVAAGELKGFQFPGEGAERAAGAVLAGVGRDLEIRAALATFRDGDYFLHDASIIYWQLHRWPAPALRPETPQPLAGRTGGRSGWRSRRAPWPPATPPC